MSQQKLTDQIMVRLSDGMRERLDKLAGQDKRPTAQWVRVLLEDAIEKREAEQIAKSKLQEVAA